MLFRQLFSKSMTIVTSCNFQKIIIQFTFLMYFT